MYSQSVFAMGQLLAEMSDSILCAVLYFILYYYPAGMNVASSRAGYAFSMILVAELYSSHCKFTIGFGVAGEPNRALAFSSQR
jgi:hypothetical protein